METRGRPWVVFRRVSRNYSRSRGRLYRSQRGITWVEKERAYVEFVMTEAVGCEGAFAYRCDGAGPCAWKLPGFVTSDGLLCRLVV